MEIQYHTPNYPLSEFIQYMVFVSGELPIPYIKELPDGGINLVLELNEHTSNFIYLNSNLDTRSPINRSWITGIQKQAIVYRNQQNWTVISIRFSVGGFSLLTGIPIHEIEAVGQDPATLLGPSFDGLYQRVLNEPTTGKKFALIESYFTSFHMDNMLEREIIHFFTQNIERDLNWLVCKSGYSQKHLIYLLRKHTGFSPKYLQRIFRFNQLVQAVQNQKDSIDWFSLIQRFGYYDQAHLIKDFHHFAGIKPKEYFSKQLAINENQGLPSKFWHLRGAL